MKKIMKQVATLAAAFGILSGAVSCADLIEAILGTEETEIPVPKPDDEPDDPDNPPTPDDPDVFQVTLEQSHVNAATLAIVVTVTCDQEWTAVLTDGSWCELGEPVTGEDNVSTFSLLLGFNTSETARHNTLIVKSGNKETRHLFSQDGTAGLFTPGILQLRGTEAGTVTFTTSLDWTASAREDWLQLLQASGKAGEPGLLRVAARDEFVDVGFRRDTVTILFDGTYSLKVPVTQYQKDVVILGTESVALDYTAQSFTVETDSNVDYTIHADDDWIHPVTTPGTRSLNHGTDLFTVDENPLREPRIGSVTFMSVTADGAAMNSAFTVVQTARHPLLWHTACGLYGLDGKDIVCQPNSWQSSVRKLPDGTFSFRLLHPESLTVHALDGIPQGISAGDRVSFTYRFYLETATPQSSRVFTATVIRADDTRLWMEGEDGTGFVVKQ